jgi:hypothetical protein
MALPPPKPRQLTDAEIQDEVEKTIDDQIMRSPDTDMIIAVEFLIDGFTCKHWPPIQQKYLAAGWTHANYIADGSLGDYIHLIA